MTEDQTNADSKSTSDSNQSLRQNEEAAKESTRVEPQKKNKSAKSIVIREFTKLGIYVAIFYVLCGLLIKFSPAVEFILLRPQGKNAFYEAKIDKQEVSFDNGHGDKLNGWLFKVPESKFVVLVNHGNAGNLINRLLIARDIKQLGFSVFLYDYRGYGASTGKPTPNGLYEDGLAAYDYVNKELGYKPEQIVIYGESIGTGVTCRVAKERPYAGLILQSALSSLPDVARDGIVWFRAYPDFVFPEPHYSSISIIKELKGPILFIHGENDKMVPAAHSKKMFELAQEPKQIVLLPHAGHNDVQDQDEGLFYAGLKSFLTSTKAGS